MVIIYLGDVGSYLADICCSIDTKSTLITQDNINNLSAGTYYTSLGDLGNLENLGRVLIQASKIIYLPPEHWSDEKNNNSKMKAWTEDYLNVFRFRCIVDNYTPVLTHNKSMLLELSDYRKTHEQQLWIAGCSISHGVGVTDNSRYGTLIANKLDKKVSFLTKSGSSIQWAADQILRSNIKAGDIVVWGLTAWHRTTSYKHQTLRYLNVNMLLENPDIDFKLEDLTSDQVFYQSLISVFQVINFCRAAGAELVIASMLDNSIISYLEDFPNLIMLYNLWGRDQSQLFLDIGTDYIHPGPITHQFYAEQIYQKIQNLVAIS
jgi:hypothetical protein